MGKMVPDCNQGSWMSAEFNQGTGGNCNIVRMGMVMWKLVCQLLIR